MLNYNIVTKCRKYLCPAYSPRSQTSPSRRPPWTPPQSESARIFYIQQKLHDEDGWKDEKEPGAKYIMNDHIDKAHCAEYDNQSTN